MSKIINTKHTTTTAIAVAFLASLVALAGCGQGQDAAPVTDEAATAKVMELSDEQIDNGNKWVEPTFK